MAKGAYGGVNDLSRKITKIYGGVGGTSKKIVKGYAGVNGVARQFWPAITPPPEVYAFYKDGAFNHVPTGFNFNSNQQNVVRTSGYTDIKQYLETNKTIWFHDTTYIRGWSENGVIDSNFVYDADIPIDYNHIIFPTWDATYTDENRAKIPSGVNNYYLKIVGLGYFYVRLLMLDDSVYGFDTIDINNRDYVYIDSDTPQTVTVKIDREYFDRYIDRVEIYTAGHTSTDDNAWLTNTVNARQHNDSASTWSQTITRFYYQYNSFEVYWSNGSPHRDVVKRVMSNAQVYSLTWRSYQPSPTNKNGGELLSRAAFDVEHIIYDYQGNVISDTTVPAEQVIYNGLAFYRYRVQRDYGWYNFDGWYPRPFIDERTAYLLSEDGRLEYEFYESVNEIYNTAQISEISVITQ